MKLGCFLLGVGLLSCGSVEPVDPLASQGGFCEEWAKRACSKVVVTRCDADDEKSCQSEQRRYCESIVPASLYSQDGAEECLEFVEEAYKDGDLTSEERDAVRSLGAPCDMVLSGDGRTGDECDKHSDCDREGGYDCVIPLGKDVGSCQKPNKVGGGLACENADDVCAEGFYCDGENCLARKNAGKAC